MQIKLRAGWRDANSLQKSAAKGSSEMDAIRKDPQNISHGDGKREKLAPSEGVRRA